VTAVDVSAINQLLGRLAYFHTLFIEPTLSTAGLPLRALGHGDPLTRACCNHCGGRIGRPTVAAFLKPTAWNVVHELGEAVHVPTDPACVCGDACCSVCRVLMCGSAVAAMWITVECHAYRMSCPDTDTRAIWILAAGSRLAAAFAAQYQTSCPRLEQAAGRMSAPLHHRAQLAELPLTGEFLALWQDPASISKKPVTNWLNHCTDLADVARQRPDRSRP
jgi:hypothetical protein